MWQLCFWLVCRAISEDLFEAADIDGASWLQKVRYIIIPGIKSVSTVVFLLLVIWTIKDYAIAYVLAKGGPSRATEIMTIFIQQTAFKSFDFGKAAAAGMLMLLVSLVFTFFYFRAVNRGEERLMKTKKGGKAVTVILVIIVCIFALFPFIWMISTSFKTNSEIYTAAPTFVPKHPTMDGYTSMFTTETATFNFKQWAANSIFVAFLTTIFSMIIAVLGGYGISRYRFKGRGALSYIVLTTQVLPGSLLMIPLYIIMSNLGLLNTKIGLMLAYVTFTVPFCTWMMKGFFDSIPISLEEAARVDGAGTFRCFFTVTLPLTVPGLVSTGLFAFINGWNEYLFASSFMQSYDNWTLPVGIASFKGQYATDWGTLMAGSVLITIPVVILFLCLQKHLVGGMTAGAVKQ